VNPQEAESRTAKLAFFRKEKNRDKLHNKTDRTTLAYYERPRGRKRHITEKSIKLDRGSGIKRETSAKKEGEEKEGKMKGHNRRFSSADKKANRSLKGGAKRRR